MIIHEVQNYRSSEYILIKITVGSGMSGLCPSPEPKLSEPISGVRKISCPSLSLLRTLTRTQTHVQPRVRLSRGRIMK